MTSRTAKTGIEDEDAEDKEPAQDDQAADDTVEDDAPSASEKTDADDPDEDEAGDETDAERDRKADGKRKSREAEPDAKGVDEERGLRLTKSQKSAKDDKDDEEPDGDRAARRQGMPVRGLFGGRRDRLATVLVLLVLAAVATTAVLQWREADRLRQEARTQQQVRTRAAEFGQALLAYNHNDLKSARARIQRLTATDFGKSYDVAFDGLADVIGTYKADATATVRDTYINEIDGDRAKALVILDSEVRSTAGTRRVIGTKLLLELIREKGRWRVSGLTPLEADDETMTRPDGTPVTPKDGSDPTLPSPEPSKSP